jgi:Protein of unknown function (DUF3300)
MNITPKIETVALREIVLFSLRMCSLAFLLSDVSVCFAQPPSATADTQTHLQISTTELPGDEPAPTIPPEELEALVAPIALYPDPLLIQVLAASTYPLEIVQLKQWTDENKKLKGKALAEAVVQQNWDPSVQALAAFTAVVNKLANKIQWTTDLGNAFLAQQSDVMDAVQRLRAKAQVNGTLKTNDKQKVATETTDHGAQAITIESAQQDVVYVPTYNTQLVYGDSGDSGYSRYSGYSNASDYSGYSNSSSGYSDDGYSYVGYALAAAGGYAWGYYNWRDRYASMNYDNYYNKNYSRNWNNKVNNNWNNKVNNASNNVNNLSRSAANSSSRLPTQGQGGWQHNPAHRGNTPYGNGNLANRFGQDNNRLSGGAGNRASQPVTARAVNQLGQNNRFSQPTRANPGNQLARNSLSRPTGGARPSARPSGVGAPNRVGNRVPSNWPSTARGGAFGPSNGDVARTFSGRGAQSMAPSRMGPPQGLRAGGPPMGGGFRGGLPGGGFHGGPPMGGGFGGPPIGGGLPIGGAPPPPPPPGP